MISKFIKDLWLMRAILSRIPDKMYLQLLFRYHMGKKLDLKNPKTFNEKIQWLKLYDRKPEYIKMVDKYEAKKYVAALIGEKYIIPTYGVWNSFDEIDFNSLPDQFVLKCTHDSGGIVLCRDKSKFDYNEAKKKISKHLKRNFFWSTREWPYKKIRPRIIAEKYLESEGNIVPEDFKVYCINEKPKYIVCLHNRFSKDKTLNETVYDTSWEHQHISLNKYFPISDDTMEKPECLDELIAICKKLAKGIVQVRLDFYIIRDQIFFGEITLYTGSGFRPMIPNELDKKLGQELDLSPLLQ